MLKKAFQTIHGQWKYLEISKISFSEINSEKIICNDQVLKFNWKKEKHYKERRKLEVYEILMKVFIAHSIVNLAIGQHCILCPRQFLFYLFASSTFTIRVFPERLFWYFNYGISLLVILMKFLQLYKSCITLEFQIRRSCLGFQDQDHISIYITYLSSTEKQYIWF